MDCYTSLWIQELQNRAPSFDEWDRVFPTWSAWFRHHFINNCHNEQFYKDLVIDQESDDGCDEGFDAIVTCDALIFLVGYVECVRARPSFLPSLSIPPSSCQVFIDWILRDHFDLRYRRAREEYELRHTRVVQRRELLYQMEAWTRTTDVALRFGSNRNGHIRAQEWGSVLELLQMGFNEWKWGYAWAGLVRESIENWTTRREFGVGLVGLSILDLRDQEREAG